MKQTIQLAAIVLLGVPMAICAVLMQVAANLLKGIADACADTADALGRWGEP